MRYTPSPDTYTIFTFYQSTWGCIQIIYTKLSYVLFSLVTWGAKRQKKLVNIEFRKKGLDLKFVWGIYEFYML